MSDNHQVVVDLGVELAKRVDQSIADIASLVSDRQEVLYLVSVALSVSFSRVVGTTIDGVGDITNEKQVRLATRSFFEDVLYEQAVEHILTTGKVVGARP
jgi:hypothetical protein